MLVDHDLAVSTLAARAAASARANPYAVVISGLGALDSALHGNASRGAYRMLSAVATGQPPRTVIASSLATGRGGVPGFGHRIYTVADPRAELIMELLAGLPGSQIALKAAEALTEVVADHGGSFRNVDLALATLALAAGMPEEAGEVIFALARTGGWIAHAVDEYAQPPLRLRPVGRYVGP
jgi:citrate synthase